MSSAEGDVPTLISGGEMKKSGSKFVEEITSLPVIQSASTLYCTVKDKSRILKLTLKPFEFSCTKALGIFHKALPSRLESSMDKKAARCVSYAKETCPNITKTPREIYSDGKRKVVTTMINATEAFAKSRPGQTVIRGLDWSIERGENLIEYLEDHGPSKGRRHRRSRTKAQLETKKEESHASPDSGVKSEMKESSSDLVRQAPSETSSSEEKKRRVEFLLSSTPISYRIYHVAVILPLELLVVIMIKIHRFLYKHGGKKAIRGKDTVEDKPLTPEKVAEIESRRKVSPRKRVKRSFFGAIKFAAYGFVGYRSGNILPESTSAIKDESVSSKNIGEKKRKFQETQAEGSESEKDPDNVPSEKSEERVEFKLGGTDDEENEEEEKAEGENLEEGEKGEAKTKEAEEENTEEEGKVDPVEQGEDELDDEANANIGNETLSPGVLEVKSDTEHVAGHTMRDDDAKKGTDDDMVDISMQNVESRQPRMNSPVSMLAPSRKVE